MVVRAMYEMITRLVPKLQNAVYGTLKNETKVDKDGLPILPISFGPYHNWFLIDLDRAMDEFKRMYPDIHMDDYANILEKAGIEVSTKGIRAADVSKLDGLTVMALIFGIFDIARKIDEKNDEHFFDLDYEYSQFTWDEEGTLVKVSLRRVINDNCWKVNPNAYDPIVIKVSGGRYGDDFECTVDGRDLCYAAAKAYTEALKKYGFYGYFSSTCDDFRVNASVLMERFLFIKAYALNALEVRALSKAWDNPHSWHKAYKTDFEKEIELLLFDM